MRYLVFAHDTYDPSGGWADCIGRFEYLSGAEKAAKEARFDCVEIIDLTTGEEVEFDR